MFDVFHFFLYDFLTVTMIFFFFCFFFCLCCGQKNSTASELLQTQDYIHSEWRSFALDKKNYARQWIRIQVARAKPQKQSTNLLLVYMQTASNYQHFVNAYGREQIKKKKNIDKKKKQCLLSRIFLLPLFSLCAFVFDTCRQINHSLHLNEVAPYTHRKKQTQHLNDHRI